MHSFSQSKPGLEKKKKERQSVKSKTTRLEVIVDDGRLDLVEVLESVDDLHDNRAAFLLRHQLILLQVEVQIVAVAVLQHCAEPAGDHTPQNRDSSARPEN